MTRTAGAESIVARTDEARKRKLEGQKRGGKVTAQRWRDTQQPLEQSQRAELAAIAERMGLPPPETIQDALQLKQIQVAEERRRKIIADREHLDGYRIPIELVRDFIGRIRDLVSTILRTVPSAIDDVVLTEDQKIMVRRRLVDWSDTAVGQLQKEDLYDATHTRSPDDGNPPKRRGRPPKSSSGSSAVGASASAQHPGPGRPVEDDEEELVIEESEDGT